MKNILIIGIILLTTIIFCKLSYGHHRHHGYRANSIHHIHRHHVHRPHHIHRHHYRHHHRSHFVVPFLGALTGTIAGNILTTPSTTVVQQPITVVQTPTIVTSPIVVENSRRVWVPGQYVQQIQSNGIVINVWQPGHWTIIK